jgi:hypothetical protein
MEKKNCEMLFCPMCKRLGPHLRRKTVGQGRVGKLRAYGNAIVPPLAAKFIQAIDLSR